MFVFVWMFASGWVFAAVPSSLSLCLCVCVGVFVWNGRMVGMMTQTGQSGGRLVSGPYSYYQAGCSIWQLTESLQAPTLHSPTKRSALQSAPISGCPSLCFYDCRASTRALDAHFVVLDHISQVEESSPKMHSCIFLKWHPQHIKRRKEDDYTHWKDVCNFDTRWCVENCHPWP